MRVAHVITRLHGGAAVAACSLVSGLEQRGIQAVLLHGNLASGEDSYAGHAAGVDVRSVPYLGPRLRPLADLAALVELMRVLYRLRPDVVHTHTAKAGTLGRLAAWLCLRPRPVLVHTFHGHVLSEYFGGFSSFVFRGVERLLARLTDRLIAPSGKTMEEILALGIGRRDQFSVIPYGFELTGFAERQHDGEGVRERLGVARSDVLLLAIGRLVPIKRLDTLLRGLELARRTNPHVFLAIAGAGPSRAQLEALSLELGTGEAVHFLGFREYVAPVVAAADVVVLTSANEGLPVALIEAGAAGKPVVATAVGGVPEVVTPDTGIMVAPGDADGLASAILRLADDRELRVRLGSNARAHVNERFTRDGMVDRTLAAYRRCAA